MKMLYAGKKIVIHEDPGFHTATADSITLPGFALKKITIKKISVIGFFILCKINNMLFLPVNA